MIFEGIYYWVARQDAVARLADEYAELPPHIADRQLRWHLFGGNLADSLALGRLRRSLRNVDR